MDNNRIEKARKYSHIGMSSHNNFVYAMQYYKSFEILYDSGTPIDTIALPLLYTVRHYLELVFKYNIEYFHKYSGSKNMVGKLGHSLLPLFNAFKEHWSLTKENFNIVVDDQKLLSSLSKLIDIMNNYDSHAISFRYSHDKEKNKNFDWLDTIDIHELKLLLDDAKLLLNHSTDVFEQEFGRIDEAINKR